ncbi:MAG: hypothetical protein LBQ74_20500 [Prevotella sp.]|jgi:hypothetical protein|nr:hypothetical protein [Prevotella sp.]
MSKKIQKTKNEVAVLGEEKALYKVGRGILEGIGSLADKAKKQEAQNVKARN